MRLLWAIFAALALVALPLVAAPGADGRERAESTPPARDDLERAARDYRIAVYNTFRQNRPEFERRNAAWRKLLADWKANGAKAEHLPQLRAWLDTATAASRAGHVMPLPPRPQFATVAELPDRPPPAETNLRHREAEPAMPVPPPLARRTTEAAPPSRSAAAAGLPQVPLTISPGVARSTRPQASQADRVAALADAPPRRPAPPVGIEPPTETIPPQPGVAQPVRPEATDGIDVEEVAVRVAGHNLAVATLAEEVRKLESPAVEQLVAYVERLEAHAIRAGDLSPYYALVGESDRVRLRPLVSIDEPRRLLAERIDHAIATTSEDPALPAVTRSEQLARLNELHRRLSQLSSRTP